MEGGPKPRFRGMPVKDLAARAHTSLVRMEAGSGTQKTAAYADLLRGYRAARHHNRSRLAGSAGAERLNVRVGPKSAIRPPSRDVRIASRKRTSALVAFGQKCPNL